MGEVAHRGLTGVSRHFLNALYLPTLASPWRVPRKYRAFLTMVDRECSTVEQCIAHEIRESRMAKAGSTVQESFAVPSREHPTAPRLHYLALLSSNASRRYNALMQLVALCYQTITTVTSSSVRRLHAHQSITMVILEKFPRPTDS